jgi:hypothetical protein
LNALRLIRRFFNTKELLQQLTSNYCEVWMISSLKLTIQNSLLTASANALKMAYHYPKRLINYITLHKTANRATPKMLTKYELALQLHKIYNHCIPYNKWIILRFDQILTTRQTTFMTNHNIRNNTRRNALINRINELNGLIGLESLKL